MTDISDETWGEYLMMIAFIGGGLVIWVVLTDILRWTFKFLISLF